MGIHIEARKRIITKWFLWAIVCDMYGDDPEESMTSLMLALTSAQYWGFLPCPS